MDILNDQEFLIPCLCLACIPLVIIIILVFWVYQDATKRGVQSPAVWALLTAFLPLIGILVYLLYGRNQGKTPIIKPGNKNPTASKVKAEAPEPNFLAK